jgi:ADP-ribose pyrophosphatase YjhB (NUDIX family)
MTLRSPIQHCKTCGNPVLYRLPDDGDTKQRAICTVCHAVHYENPLNVVGTIPIWQSADGPQVLLCQRNIEPRKGLWTLPAGFMELDETTAQGALRETIEEAGAHIVMQELYTVINVQHVSQVHFFYRAQLLSAQFNPGFETMQARLFLEQDIPWNDLAFRTVRDTLQHYFSDYRQGVFTLHHFDV